MSIRSQQKKITICQHMVQSYNFNFLSFFLARDKIRFFLQIYNNYIHRLFSPLSW